MTAPLTPVDCDLRDFTFMPVDVRRLLTSETWLTGTGDERAASMSLWLESWHQVPAGSLPDNDRMLAHLSQCAAWKKVRSFVLRGWVKADDGRLYHPVVAEKALEAWLEKLAQRISGAEGNAKRWGMAFDRAPMEAAMQDARQRLIALNPQSRALSKRRTSGLPKASPPDPNSIAPRPGNDRTPNRHPNPDYMSSGSQGTGTGTGTVKPKPPDGDVVATASEPGSAEAEADDDSSRPAPESAPTHRGALALLLRNLGVRVLVTDSELIAWADELHVTLDEARAAVTKAREFKPLPEKIPAKYLDAVIRNARTEGAPNAASPRPARPLTATERSIAVVAALTGRDRGADPPAIDGTAERVG